MKITRQMIISDCHVKEQELEMAIKYTQQIMAQDIIRHLVDNKGKKIIVHLRDMIEKDKFDIMYKIIAQLDIIENNTEDNMSGKTKHFLFGLSIGVFAASLAVITATVICKLLGLF